MRLDHGVLIHHLLVGIPELPGWGRCEHSWMRAGLCLWGANAPRSGMAVGVCLPF